MYFSKKLKWLSPYIKDITRMYPKFKKIDKVTIMRASYSKRDRAYGENRERVDGSYQIALRTEFQYIEFYPLTIKLLPFSKIDILINLAHELAHCYHFEHSPEHKLLDCQILSYFMHKMHSEGYISEEVELKDLK